MLENGKFPKPICLLCEKNQFYIVVGNHRFLAWRSALRITNEIACSKEGEKEKKRKTIQEKLGVKAIARVPVKQEVWIAY